MNEQIEHLKAAFHEIFQTDQAGLDFGIYRIMRQERAEFDAYLETQLLTDLRQSFRKWQTQTGEDLQRQLTEAINGAIQLGFDPEASPKVKELRETLDAIKHRESLEEGVLSDLVQFLGRYYNEGDFLSLPCYRKNSYAIPYNGEEVKLHWANADQYYVKTAERFRDYRFLLSDNRAVHFKITAANTEAGNNKAETGKERRFQLIESEFMREENNELLIFFRYEIDAEKRKQAEINTESARRILAKEIENGRIVFPDDELAKTLGLKISMPMVKRYKKNLKSTVNPVSTWIETGKKRASTNSNGEVASIGAGLNTEATKELDCFRSLKSSFIICVKYEGARSSQTDKRRWMVSGHDRRQSPSV